MWSYTIRESHAGDIEALARLKNETEHVSMPYKKHIRTVEEEMAYMTEVRARCHILACESDKTIIGFVAYAQNVIELLFVHADFRGRGIGTALLRAVQETTDMIHISVIKDNLTARDFYLSHGFRFMGNIAGTNGVRYEWHKKPPAGM